MDNKQTLPDKIEMAARLRKEGYNCASAVFLCFPEISGMDSEQALKVTNALGSGIGGSRELCGAAAAMALLAGFKFPADPAKKGEASKLANKCLTMFQDQNQGCLRCSQLKDRQLQGGDVRSCNELVAQCVRLAHENLNSPEA